MERSLSSSGIYCQEFDILISFNWHYVAASQKSSRRSKNLIEMKTRNHFETHMHTLLKAVILIAIEFTLVSSSSPTKSFREFSRFHSPTTPNCVPLIHHLEY